MRTSNPLLRESTFSELAPATEGRMTLAGTVNATLILTGLLMTTAIFAWNRMEADPSSAGGYMITGAVGGLILALVTSFKPHWAGITAPLYALVKGLFVGAISAIYNAQFNGIVIQAVLLTAGVLFALLAAYRSGLIKATENFKLGVVAATGGIFLVYLITIVLGLFGIQIPYIHQGGMIGIGFSLFVVVIAALNLVLDFDFIEKGCEHGAPKHMEWYAGFGLLVTLVWLYVEMLRLLAKISSSRN
jgi:uncharacterized YccA/Bax inhibitor family protein